MSVCQSLLVCHQLKALPYHSIWLWRAAGTEQCGIYLLFRRVRGNRPSDCINESRPEVPKLFLIVCPCLNLPATCVPLPAYVFYFNPVNANYHNENYICLYTVMSCKPPGVCVQYFGNPGSKLEGPIGPTSFTTQCQMFPRPAENSPPNTRGQLARAGQGAQSEWRENWSL